MKSGATNWGDSHAVIETQPAVYDLTDSTNEQSIASPGDSKSTDITTSVPTTVTTTKQKGCNPSRVQWIGDGTCDDETNTPECDYDGNDCCKLYIKDDSCTECECKGTTTTTTTTTRTKTTTTETKTTKYDQCTLQGNKNCDDSQNTEMCNWDGGECCGWDYFGQFDKCSQCKCEDNTSTYYRGLEGCASGETPHYFGCEIDDGGNGGWDWLG